MRHVIIGAGAAGTAAARTIKQIDPSADVLIVGEERFPPYNRYLLTEFLCDRITDWELFHPADEPLEDLKIQLRKGERVVRIDPEKRALSLELGDTVNYDRLLIATGRRPQIGETLRPFQPHIHNYYTIEDVVLLKEKLSRIKRAVVCGSAVSTLNLLSGLCELGKEVVYVIRGPRVDIPIISTAIEEDLDAAMVDKGIEIVREDRIVSVAPRNGHYAVETYQGRDLAGDVVFASDSYRPSIQCVRETGIEVNKGILVDLELHTSVEGVFAAGDCVEIYHPKLRNYWINFGWPNAVQQGRVAGSNMAGRPETYQINDTVAFDILGKPFRARWWD